MTIVQLVRPAAGGMRRHVARLSAGLRAAGHAVLVTGAVDPDWAEDLRSAGIACAPLPLGARPGPGDLRIARALRAAANTADLVHAHGLRAGMVAAIAGVPFAYTLHGFPRGRIARMVEGRVLHLARVVIAVSPSLADYARAAGVSTGRMHVVPGGIEVPGAVAPLAGAFSPQAEPRIGYLGRLSPEKGVDLLLQAFALVLGAHARAELAIAGTGPRLAQLRSLAARLRLGGRVRFLGPLADSRAFLQAVQIYVQPSRREGQGLAAAEALAAGCRVVAAHTGGLYDHLQGMAEFHTPGDPRSLAAAISRSIAAPPRPFSAQEIARRFGVQAQVTATLAAYAQAVAGEQPP